MITSALKHDKKKATQEQYPSSVKGLLKAYVGWAGLVLIVGMVLGIVLGVILKIRHLKQFNGLADPYTPFSRWAPLVWPESGAWSQSGELALWAGLVGVLYLLTWLVYVRLFSTLLPVSLSVAARADALASLPAVLSGLYLVSDAVSPRKALCAAFILVIVSKAGMLLWTLWHKDPLARISLAKRKWALFLSAFIIYTLLNLGVNVRGGLVGPQGDEPYFLLISHSLWYDGDLDLANNFQNRDYWSFFPNLVFEDDPHGPVLENGSIYSSHGIGLPMVILPAYVVGNYRGVLVFLSGLTAFLSLQLYLFVLEVIKFHRTALLIWVLMAFSSPLLIYSSQVYPEVWAGMVALVCLRKMRNLNRTQNLKTLLLGGLVGTLPWFHVRYLPLEGALLFVFALQVWKLQRMRLLGIFLVPVFVFFVGLCLFHQLTFGDPSPLAGQTSIGYDTAGLFGGNPLVGLLGILFDQESGLMVFSPIYILALLGVPEALRMFSRETFQTLFIFGTTWISLSFLPVWFGGIPPPGRYLVPVLAMLSLPLAAYLKQVHGRLQKYLLLSLSCITYISVVLFFLFPFTRYNNFDGRNPFLELLYQYTGLDFTWIFPSFIKMRIGTCFSCLFNILLQTICI